MGKNKGNKHPDEPYENSNPGGTEGEPVIRDPSTGSGQADGKPSRRIDPETGEAREMDAERAEQTDQPDLDDELQRLLEGEDLAGEPAPDASAAASGSEHLADLKRIQAEYANYRKRVERDRSVARELALAEMAQSLLPVLDDLDMAEAHGDLPEGSSVALVAHKLRGTMEKHGLERVSPEGEKFDPSEHEAIAHVAADVDEDTVIEVAVVGYRMGERLLRPAKVVVSAAKE